MGQNTLGDHMHIQSIRSRHRACNIFPPLLFFFFSSLCLTPVTICQLIRPQTVLCEIMAQL